MKQWLLHHEIDRIMMIIAPVGVIVVDIKNFESIIKKWLIIIKILF